jgi:hypothetical protein
MRKDDFVEELKRDGAWVLCRHLITEEEGYVPATFLAPHNSLESESWFFGPITRAKVPRPHRMPGPGAPVRSCGPP